MYKVGGVICLNLPHEMDHEWVASDEVSRGAVFHKYNYPQKSTTFVATECGISEISVSLVSHTATFNSNLTNRYTTAVIKTCDIVIILPHRITEWRVEV